MTYLLIQWLHVVAAVVALGTNLTYTVWLKLAARDERSLLFALRGIRYLDRRLANPGYLVLLITGLLMVYQAGFPLTTPWLLVSLLLYIATALLGFFVYAPTFRRQIRLAEELGPQAEAYRAMARRSVRLAWLTTVIVLIILFLMVVKPPLW
jgi:uncharacterized membrane protein